MKCIPKQEAILELCRGRRVLHLGCVGHYDMAMMERVNDLSDSLHRRLSDECEVLGVDLAEEVIDEYRERGIFDNIVAGNVEELEELRLGGDFDWVVIGDLIEHLSNPGRMLQGVRTMSGSGTRVILTTPHAFGLAPFLRHFFKRFREGREHVMTFNRQNLENLVVRHGFEVERADTCYQPESARKGIAFRVGRKLFEAFPHLGGTLFMVLRPASRDGVA